MCDWRDLGTRILIDLEYEYVSMQTKKSKMAFDFERKDLLDSFFVC